MGLKHKGQPVPLYNLAGTLWNHPVHAMYKLLGLTTFYRLGN